MTIAYRTPNDRLFRALLMGLVMGEFTFEQVWLGLNSKDRNEPLTPWGHLVESEVRALYEDDSSVAWGTDPEFMRSSIKRSCQKLLDLYDREEERVFAVFGVVQS